MKIALITVGKTQTKELRDSVSDYSKRISRYARFEMIETSDEKLADNLEKFDRIFLLDEKGKEYVSVEFAEFMNRQMNSGVKSVAFAVGGPFGFSDEIRALAKERSGALIALSKMTLPHDLVRVVFLEQLYRAFSILKNEKYHH